MKTTHEIKKADHKKLLVAARLNRVRIIEEGSVELPNGVYLVQLDTPDPSNFIKFGITLATCAGTELDHIFAAEKAKAEGKAKAK
jgi:hypothetical protein